MDMYKKKTEKRKLTRKLYKKKDKKERIIAIPRDCWIKFE
jgi:hypothetical protein